MTRFDVEMSPTRTGIERGMVIVVAIGAVIVALTAIPSFVLERQHVPAPLVAASATLFALLVASLPLSLLRRGRAAPHWLLAPVAIAALLFVLEFVEAPRPEPGERLPWLMTVAVIAITALAVAVQQPVIAGAGCSAFAIAELALGSRGHLPSAYELISGASLLALACGLIALNRGLRTRADQVDAAARATQQAFAETRLRQALDTERIRTDALLHDSVLSALIVAGSEDPAPDRAVQMAAAAMQTAFTDRDDARSPFEHTSFDAALRDVDDELAQVELVAEVDLSAARRVELPGAVARALVSAMLQAATNSIRHAGAGAHRWVTASATAGGGIRITVRDDGVGFDPAAVSAERLGVRVSILEAARQAGASAEVISAPGRGTTVELGWQPEAAPLAAAAPRDSGLVSKPHLTVIVIALTSVAILAGSLYAALSVHVLGPILAVVLCVTLFPFMIITASRGSMPRWGAWTLSCAGCVLSLVTRIGLTPDRFNWLTISWYVCGVLLGAVMVMLAGHLLPPMLAAAFHLVGIVVWAGVDGAIRLGLPGMTVLFVAGFVLHLALGRIARVAARTDEQRRRALAEQAAQEAFRQERQQRLRTASRNAVPLLQRVIAERGVLSGRWKAECRILEQTLRDEIRGRSLLTDAVRDVILRHRRRGAQVQVLDDGGLDGIDPRTRAELLDDVARRLAPVRSARIVIRTGRPDSPTAITIVASSPDETAAVLGLEDDDAVELFAHIPRPAAVPA